MRVNIYKTIRYYFSFIISIPLILFYSLFFYVFLAAIIVLPTLIALSLYETKKQFKKDFKSILNESKIFYKLFKPTLNI